MFESSYGINEQYVYMILITLINLVNICKVLALVECWWSAIILFLASYNELLPKIRASIRKNIKMSFHDLR